MDKKHDSENTSSEHTPLIQINPPTHHYGVSSHRWVRRYPTAIALLVSILIIALMSLGLDAKGAGFFDGCESETSSQDVVIGHEIERPHEAWPQSEGMSYEALKQILLSTPDEEKVREWSKYYTAGPHLAGQNLTQAEWTREKWKEFGVHDVEIIPYDVYLNYPLHAELSMLEDGNITFKASLEEDALDEDPTTSLPDREKIPVFHGYSANGNVTGQFVYANYGTFADYEMLLGADVEIRGKIIIVRYGAIFRGLKVKRASELGAIGVIMYSDPGDDGEITEENGYLPYPDGPARNPSSVQRGSCEYLSIVSGDPTTIGYPSKPGVHRQPVDGNIPDIPSIPISYKDALPILQALNGHGPNISSFPASWRTGGLRYKGVEYSVGPSPSVTLNLINEQNYTTTPIWNTIGVINGTISDEVIVIGNHRDAWVTGGAGDPNGGSATLNEVIRSFGKALRQGWKPQRTIVFASWDGEEYGMIGSTEWVEEYLPWLSGSTIAYINVDMAARGPHFTTSAAPLLNKALYQVTNMVPSPNQTVPGQIQTVRDLWDGQIKTIGSGSDFTAFQDFAGIPSMDVAFSAGPKDPIYHYHSNYDSFHWMETYGDPGFQYHIALVKIISLLAAKLVEEPVIQFNATDYAFSLAKYMESLEGAASSISANNLIAPFKKMNEAISFFQSASIAFDAKAEKLERLLEADVPTETKSNLYRATRSINTKYKFLERSFLHGAGLDNRSWFKHVVFAPGRWTGYAGATFPGLVEALEDDNDAALGKWASIISERIYSAGKLLLKDSDDMMRSRRSWRTVQEIV